MKTAAQAGFTPLPEPLPGAVEWELWTHTPALIPDGDTVDPLSLTLSQQDRTDERVQLGLEPLTRQCKGRVPYACRFAVCCAL